MIDGDDGDDGEEGRGWGGPVCINEDWKVVNSCPCFKIQYVGIRVFITIITHVLCEDSINFTTITADNGLLL